MNFFAVHKHMNDGFFRFKFMQLNLKLIRPLVHVQQYRYSYVLLSFSQSFVSHKNDLSSHTSQVPNEGTWSIDLIGQTVPFK
jgi:hypothetical protein